MSSSAVWESIGRDGLVDADALDIFSAPMSVDEALLEVELFGPGTSAMRLLEGLWSRALTAQQQLAVAEAWERQSRWVAARCHQADVAFAGAHGSDGSRDGDRDESCGVLELALATDRGDLFTRRRLREARVLTTTLAASGEALETGVLSHYRARLICEQLADLDPAVARGIEARILPTAHEVTVASLSRRLRKAVLAAATHDTAAEHRRGADARRVVLGREPAEAGLLGMHAYLPAEQAVAVREALQVKAGELKAADRAARRQARRSGTPDGGLPARRSNDQRLADALTWFVLGPDPADPAHPARPQVQVNLTVSLPTLLHLREHPGELAGYGPIPADIARSLAGDARWRRFVHEPVTGHLLDRGRSLYRPDTELHQFLIARDVKDRFPGSNRFATHGDGDHVKEWAAGGPTASTNIAQLSKTGHTAKTHRGWRVHGDANDALEWTSPHGRTYRTHPHDYTDDEEPPALGPEPSPDPYAGDPPY
jgi:hypothetical protein